MLDKGSRSLSQREFLARSAAATGFGGLLSSCGTAGASGANAPVTMPIHTGPWLPSYQKMDSSMLYKSLVLDTVAPPAGYGNYLPGVELPQWQVPVDLENFLFDREEDPAQDRNLWDENPKERRRMLDLTWDPISGEGTPPEQYERLGLPA